MQHVEAGSAPPLKLFKRSVIKQQKYDQIVDLLGDVTGKTCLDVGGDNGVISYLLRQRGGYWYSADLDEPSVEAIRHLVRERVFQVDGRRTAFETHQFDAIVVIDYLEHVETDDEFVREMARVLRPGGILVLNVPHLKRRSWLNRIRPVVGLTDERHGHVRPGYTRGDLRRLLSDGYEIQVLRSYSKAGSELVDIALNAVKGLLDRRGAERMQSRKGAIVTATESRSFAFGALTCLYPFLWLLTRVDVLLPRQDGYRLIAKAVRTRA